MGPKQLLFVVSKFGCLILYIHESNCRTWSYPGMTNESCVGPSRTHELVTSWPYQDIGWHGHEYRTKKIPTKYPFTEKLMTVIFHCFFPLLLCSLQSNFTASHQHGGYAKKIFLITFWFYSIPHAFVPDPTCRFQILAIFPKSPALFFFLHIKCEDFFLGYPGYVVPWYLSVVCVVSRINIHNNIIWGVLEGP